jgi:hypothetical protein
MKQKLLLGVFFVTFFLANAQNFYYYQEKQAKLTINRTYLILFLQFNHINLLSI